MEPGGGDPFGFIGATGPRKPITYLDLPACHDLPQRLTAGHAHAISIRSSQKTRWTFRFPKWTMTHSR